jgi:hypothetical protein
MNAYAIAGLAYLTGMIITAGMLVGLKVIKRKRGAEVTKR